MRTATLTGGKLLFFDIDKGLIKKAQGWAHPLSRVEQSIGTCCRMHVAMSIIVLQKYA